MGAVSDNRLRKLVDNFCKARREAWLSERRFFKEVRTLDESVDAACGLRKGDTIPDHQRRVGRVALKKASVQLKRHIGAIRRVKSFEDLLNVMENATEQVSRFGILACYDVAFRIGIFRNISPNFVYLHAGTREGARVLGFAGDKIDRKKLPAPLQVMTPSQIEDFLCICKGALKGGMPIGEACNHIRTECFVGRHSRVC